MKIRKLWIAGLAVLFVTMSFIVLQCGISIQNEMLTVNGEGRTLKVGEWINYTLALTSDTLPVKPISWESSDEKIVRVDNDGRATAISEGSTTITVKTGDGKTKSFKVFVVSAIAQNTIRIHYHRSGGDYSLWGLHIQGEAISKGTEWADPLAFNKTDGFGVYIDIPVKLRTKPLGFIIHRSNVLDYTIERYLPDILKNKEFWIVEGDPEVYTREPLLESTEWKERPILERENEFIDIDEQTIKFLFKTEAGANVEMFIGKSPNALKKVKSVNKYLNNGLKLGGLEPGERYYFTILVTKNAKTKQSPVLSFLKLDSTDTDKVAEWARKSVFYEVAVMNFYDGDGDGLGDFKGMTEKIGYFKDLGVNALWLMPCFDSPTYHGYDVSDYYKINPKYGTMKDFDEFLQTAHNNGIKVILDLVLNHSSTENYWFKEARKGTGSAYRNYYTWAGALDNLSENGPLGQNPWRRLNNSSYYNAIFSFGMPDLNMRNHQVRSEAKKIAKFWIDKGVDGFRLDASMHIDSEDREVTHNFWQEFNSYIKSVNPNAFVLGENWAGTDEIAEYYKDMDSSFNFPLRGVMLAAARGHERDILREISAMHNKYSSYSTRFIDSTFISNHDMDRAASELNGEADNIKLAAALQMTLPGTPFVYYGDELGQLGGGSHPHIREPLDWYAAAEGKGMVTEASWRRETMSSMGYTDVKDGVSVEEQKDKPDSILNYYKKLISIRKQNPEFFAGTYTKLKSPARTYAYDISGKIMVVHNLSGETKTVDVQKNAQELISGSSYKAKEKVKLKPYGTLILKYKN
ncbi:MAG: alpha-amylase family glycosyl hydrolase [Clostridia bacterium]|nr:alpha-amylase family glycosyl hydrolase [Clostridia bacterium]